MAKGRKTDYKPDYHPEQAKKFCLLGYTDKELAKAFGISEATLYNWKKQYFEFLEACSEGKEIADAEVSLAFYRRATGYEYPSEKVFQYEGEIIRADITAVVLPDASAALKWLQNRQPEKWRDKIDINHSGKIDTNDLSTLTDEQLNKLISELESKSKSKNADS